MSLRPRYSLLTLLLLTAGIAGGVKLWRGPHRVFIPNCQKEQYTSTSPQKMPLWKNLSVISQKEDVSEPGMLSEQNAILEFEFLRNWSEYEVTIVSETWKIPRYLVRVKQHGLGIIYIIVESSYSLNAASIKPLLPQPDSEIQSIEKLVSWVAGNSRHTTIEYKPRIVPVIGPVTHYTLELSAETPHPVYFLTETGNIYQLATIARLPRLDLEPEFDLNPVNIDEISNPQIRSRISEQLATRCE